MIKKALGFIAWIAVFQWVAYASLQFLHLNLTNWYQVVEKSMLHPPEVVFPVVWSALYVMISIAGWLLFQNRKDPSIKPAIVYYGLLVLMMWTWAPIVFKLHWVALGFFWTLGILITTFMTVVYTAEKHELIATLLSPSLLWSLYVAYLCGYLWVY